MKMTTTQRKQEPVIRVQFTGGPYHNKYALLTRDGDRNTAVFRVGPYHGRYVHGEWEAQS